MAENNADDNSPNETSQKFDSPGHPKPEADAYLKKDSHYVSLEKIKQVDKSSGQKVSGESPDAFTRPDHTKAEPKGETKKAAPEKSLNDKSKPEPTPDLVKATPGAREV